MLARREDRIDRLMREATVWRAREEEKEEEEAEEDERVGTFHSLSQQRGPRVASQTETGDRGLCMNFRSWVRETNR